MDEKVAKAVEAVGFNLRGVWEPLAWVHAHWQTIRARLVELEAENERLQTQLDAGTEAGWHALRNERDDLQSRLAAADALLRECTRYLNPHHFPDTIKRIDAHLSENGYEK